MFCSFVGNKRKIRTRQVQKENTDILLGPAASEQKFIGSAVIVDCDDDEGPRLVQWDSFVNNYRIEGRQRRIDPSDLPTYSGPRRHDEHRRQGRRRVAAERECTRA